jgi:hypothetical protein
VVSPAVPSAAAVQTTFSRSVMFTYNVCSMLDCCLEQSVSMQSTAVRAESKLQVGHLLPATCHVAGVLGIQHVLIFLAAAVTREASSTGAAA